METNNKLVPVSAAMSKHASPSLQPQEITLLKEIRLTAANAKIVPGAEISEEFLRVLSNFPAEAVEAAFRGWRDVSPFFPAVCDIRELANLWVRRKAEEREYAEQAQRREELEAARERGELIEWPQVLEKFADICARTQGDFKKEIPPAPPVETVITPDRREMIRQQTAAMRAKYGQK